MAILATKSMPINAVKVICEKDDALDLEKSDFVAYKESLDETKLTLIAGKQPTIFLCNFKLPAKEAKLIKNAMMQSGEDGKPAVGFGSWSLTVAKLCLKDIINPDYVAVDERLNFKKDGSGWAHDDLIAQLDEYGVVGDIFSYFIALTNKALPAATAKN